MPYIITTRATGRRPNDNPLGMWAAMANQGQLKNEVVSRHAVATPEEAREHVHKLGADYGAMAHLDCILDGTSHLPIGPLPDGTVIEVARVDWSELAERVDPDGDLWADTDAEILAAFNT